MAPQHPQGKAQLFLDLVLEALSCTQTTWSVAGPTGIQEAYYPLTGLKC